MVLHFQLDPETGWDSPQVMPVEGNASDRAQLLAMLALTPDEVNETRALALNELRAKFDRKAIHEQLMRLEALSPDDSPLAVPYLFDAPKAMNAPLPTDKSA